VQYLSLDCEQFGLDGGGASQPPQQGCQPEHEFTLDRGTSIVIRDHSCLKTAIVVDVLDNLDDRFSG
jgi:hypothetical protein